MTKNITINAPEDLSIDKLQIEQTISQPSDIEVGPVKVGDASVLTFNNVAFVIIILGALFAFKKFLK
jgi:hypothetical protein|tara:strand:- start:388 stop:588 length:201 start_codon:yes stop_codon:yes gene_type:complete